MSAATDSRPDSEGESNGGDGSVRPPSSPTRDLEFAAGIYRYRWWLTLGALALTLGLVWFGGRRVLEFTRSVEELGAASARGSTSTGAAIGPPVVFDPSLDVWFSGLDSQVVDRYYDIEDRFVGEDFIVVSFEARDDEFGVFGRQSLATIARLTEQFATIPGVRHVRSLTSNPWIRWGTIAAGDGLEAEDGLIITDLVTTDPSELSDLAIVERMIAVLGADRAAKQVGEARVREVIGAEAAFADFHGEPLLLGTIIDPTGTTTALQLQVVRAQAGRSVGSGAELRLAHQRGPGTPEAIHSILFQQAALRGVEHFLRLETGRAIPTEEYRRLERDIAASPPSTERRVLQAELSDPRRNFVRDRDGRVIRKFHEYDRVDGAWVDRTDPFQVVTAPANFRPAGPSEYTFHLGGEPLFQRNFEQTGLDDARLMPLMFLVIALCLALILRSLAGLGAVMVVVFGAIGATVGFVFTSGDLLNNMTIMVPIMLTAVAIADAVHLVASWSACRGEFETGRDAIVEALRLNALPIFLTTVTTAVGFYSLTISSVLPVKMLGATAAFGTVVAYVLSMTLTPCLLSLVPHRTSVVGGKRRGGSFGRFFTAARTLRLNRWVQGHRRRIVVVTAALVVIALFGVSRVEVDNDFEKFFSVGNRTMSDYAWIEDRLGGVGALELVFSGIEASVPALSAEAERRLSQLRLRVEGVRQGIEEFTPLTPGERVELTELTHREEAWNAARIGTSIDFLTELDAFEARLRREMADPTSPVSLVTDWISPLDVLRRIHQAQNQNSSQHYRVPASADIPATAMEATLHFDEFTEEWSYTPPQDGRSLVAQYYLQYENGARPGENLSTQLTADRTQLRMQGRVCLAPSSQHVRAFERIEEIARNEFPRIGVRRGVDPESAVAEEGQDALASIAVSGKLLLHSITGAMIAREFLLSMSLALVVISVLIAILFRSLRLGLVSMIPNVLPILVPLSAFGLVGVPLTAPAAFVASIALGVCVDDTIHFLTKYVRARRRGSDAEESCAFALQHVAAPVTITSIVLVLGFGMMAFGDFIPNVMLGTLTSLMIALAWIADLIVTPAVLVAFERRN